MRQLLCCKMNHPKEKRIEINILHFCLLYVIKILWVDLFARYAHNCRIGLLEFFIGFWLKNNKNSSRHAQMRQLYAYLANGSTQVCLAFVIQMTKNDKRLTNIANKSLWRHLALCYVLPLNAEVYWC